MELRIKKSNYSSENWRLAIVAGLIASAIVLHIFKIPYPPATFLKFDLSGVPLAIAAFIALAETTALGLPVFYLGIFALGGATDPIGPAMKVLAELSTYLPLITIYRSRPSIANSKGTVLSVAIAILVRASVMCLANLAITPYWLQIMGWVKEWREAWLFTLSILPHIVLFNAIAAAYIVLLTVPLIRVIRSMGVMIVGKKNTSS